MPAIPTAVLKKLYVEGSLCNTPAGCQFQIKNTLAPATMTGVGSFIMDGTAYPAARLTLRCNGETVNAADVKPSRALSFDLNRVVTIVVEELSLMSGEHRFTLEVMTREAGRLKVELTDQC